MAERQFRKYGDKFESSFFEKLFPPYASSPRPWLRANGCSRGYDYRALQNVTTILFASWLSAAQQPKGATQRR